MAVHSNTFKMPFDSQGRRIGVTKTQNSRKVTIITCGVILAIPLGSLYLGYVIGMHFTPAHDVLPDRHVVIDSSRLNYSWYNTHNLTVEFLGGIGNQLFQYSALYGLAKANGLKPVISSQVPLTKMFPRLKIPLVGAEHPGASWLKFRELKSLAFDGRTFSLNFMKNIDLLGFFQSWRYFDHVRTDLREQFTFPRDATEQVQMVLSEALQVAKKDYFLSNDLDQFPPQFVGIHVRRGDLLDDKNVKKGYVTATESYLNVAMDFYINKYKNVIFVVCSDDLAWSQKHIKRKGHNPVIFSPFEHQFPAIDLCLLSQCNHTIMTVGTFGWWGGWLAGGDVVYYKKFPRPGTEVADEFRNTDYFLPQWFGV